MSTKTRIPTDHAASMLSVERAALFAYAAGAAGILATLMLRFSA